MNETRDLYFKKVYDNQTNTYYLSLKDEIKSIAELKNISLRTKLYDSINSDNKGAYVIGFRLCFKYKGELYYIIHNHQTNDFINKIIEILKYENATDIFIKYGEID